MLNIQNLYYTHADGSVLLEDISFSLAASEKAAIFGSNGNGKSTLLKLINAQLKAIGGQVQNSFRTWTIPQISQLNNELLVSEALELATPLKALREILDGRVTEENLNLIGNDWDLEERCFQAFANLNLRINDLHRPLHTLSGGEQSLLYLAGIEIHQPELILMDEPANHLDSRGLQALRSIISRSRAAILMVSHDEDILRLFDRIIEIRKGGLRTYSGGYDNFKEMRKAELESMADGLREKEKEVRQSIRDARKTQEKQLKRNSRGQSGQDKAGLPKIVINTLKDQSEKSLAKLNEVHGKKIENLRQELNELRDKQVNTEAMKPDFDNSELHKGKLLLQLKKVNHVYHEGPLWPEALNLEVRSGEGLLLSGDNGSGKSSLLRIISGALRPSEGEVRQMFRDSLYIDQHYSLIRSDLSIEEQAASYNRNGLQEHEIRIRLNRFLFGKETWKNPCSTLSGGERMRLMLCCLNILSKAPDLIILDEPGNNLDIQSKEILCNAFAAYQGTLILVSHDPFIKERIKTEKTLNLTRGAVI